jgi:hypothetical protein
LRRRHQNWKMLCAHRSLQMRLKTVWYQSTGLTLSNASPWFSAGIGVSTSATRITPENASHNIYS